MNFRIFLIFFLICTFAFHCESEPVSWSFYIWTLLFAFYDRFHRVVVLVVMRLMVAWIQAVIQYFQHHIQRKIQVMVEIKQILSASNFRTKKKFSSKEDASDIIRHRIRKLYSRNKKKTSSTFPVFPIKKSYNNLYALNIHKCV